MGLAFVFPGQGSQYVGMGREAYGAFNVVRETFEEAGEVLGIDMARLCFEDPDERLHLTAYTQPAILTLSVALWRVLDRRGLKPSVVAGHSLGEFTALVAAGALDFRDGVRLVHRRGLYMQEAVPPGVGGMAAILGMERGVVEGLCREASRDDSIVVPANYNSPGQVVISGHREGVERAVALARERGCKRAVILNVSVPSHSPLMAGAKERLARDIEGVAFGTPGVPVVTNLSAEPISSPEVLKRHLVEQLVSPVRWEESVRRMVEDGVERFVEIGPSKVLSGIIRRTSRDSSVSSVERPEDIETLMGG